MRMKTKRITYIALVSALSFLLMQLSFPFFTASYLKIELSETPMLLLGIFISPAAALAAQAVKDLFMIMIGGAVVWGALSDFLCGGALVFGFCTAWHQMKVPDVKKFLLCSTVGIVLRCAVSIPINYIILGIEFGKAVKDVTDLFLPVILPFNLFKSICNVLLAGMVVRMIPQRLHAALAAEGKISE